MRNKLVIYLGFITLACGILLFLSGCQSSELKALENSTPVLELTTGREVSRWHQDKGVTLGKPHYPEVRIEYEPVNDYTLEDVYNEIIETLEKNNWKEDESGVPEPGFYRATIAKDDFTIEVSVKIVTDRNIVNLRLRTVP